MMFADNVGGLLSKLAGGPGKPSDEIAKILAELEYNRGSYAASAVQQAIAHREEITPHLLNIIKDTTRHAQARLDDDEDYFDDPCPCGSGKKYKKCCLLKAAPTVSGPGVC
jgi:uncharacterized protein YecA (UPF0149 family)